jgi:hypothetical protein
MWLRPTLLNRSEFWVRSFDSHKISFFFFGLSLSHTGFFFLTLASVKIYAYGNKVVDERFSLCDSNVSELCPVKAGTSFTTGVHTVPTKYTDAISHAAYLVPDLEGSIIIELLNASNPTQNLGCFRSSISNGKSTETAGVKFATLGMAAVALIVSGLSSATNSGGGGGSASSAAPMPTGAEGHAAVAANGPVASGPGTNVAAGGWHPPGITEFFSMLQGIAISGMYTLNYPQTYRSFSQNVGWSTGVITWAGMQNSIDTFRNNTGGNLTASSYQKLQQTTLVYKDSTNANQTDIIINSGSILSSSQTTRLVRRLLMVRDDNSTMSASATVNNEPPGDQKKYVTIVTGIKAYVEKLTVPNTNTFMTLLIWWAIIAGICIVAILSVKLFIEIWSIRGNKNNKFEGFRKRFHIFLALTLVRLVLIFYGIWVLYCFYQFKIGDSWGTRLIAGLVFGIMTIVLMGFAIRIIILARRASKFHGGLEYLFSHKPWLQNYGLFYDQFKIKYWWCFIPSLLASFGRNAFVALGYGNGLVQVIGQIIIDVLLTLLYVFLLPFNTKMGNGINIAIQVVRVISLCLLLTFAVQFNLDQILATGIGMALIVVQAVMAVLLAVLIMINACVGLVNMTCGNHRMKIKAKKEKQKRGAEEGDGLTLDDQDDENLTSRTTSRTSRNEKTGFHESIHSMDTSTQESTTSTNGDKSPVITMSTPLCIPATTVMANNPNGRDSIRRVRDELYHPSTIIATPEQQAQRKNNFSHSSLPSSNSFIVSSQEEKLSTKSNGSSLRRTKSNNNNKVNTQFMFDEANYEEDHPPFTLSPQGFVFTESLDKPDQ